MMNLENEKRNYKAIIGTTIFTLAFMAVIISTAVYLEGILAQRKAEARAAYVQELLEEAQLEISYDEVKDSNEIRQVFKNKVEEINTLLQETKTDGPVVALTKTETLKHFAKEACDSYVHFLCENTPLVGVLAETVKGIRATDIDFGAISNPLILAILTI